MGAGRSLPQSTYASPQSQLAAVRETSVSRIDPWRTGESDFVGRTTGSDDKKEEDIPGSMHTVVVVGSLDAAVLKEDLIEEIKRQEDLPDSTGLCHSSRAIEHVFTESCFQLHVPTSWARYRHGNKAAGTVSIIYACDLQLDSAVAKDEKSKKLLLERIEQMLADFAEMCKLAWVRKCGIVVLCTGIPEMSDFKGVLDNMMFSAKSEFLEALQFSFRVRCPKFWSAMVFSAVDSVRSFHLRTSIRKAYQKMQIELLEMRITEEPESTMLSLNISSSDSFSRRSSITADCSLMNPELLELLNSTQNELELKSLEKEMITV